MLEKVKYLLFVIFILLVFLGCKKSNDNGIAILPQDDVDAQFSDNFAIKIRTISIDSTMTEGFSTQHFGSLQDPLMGILNSHTYVQYLLSGTNVTFGEPTSTLLLDSLVLWLYVSKYYGDSTEMANLIIHEIEQDFSSDTNYYNFSQLTTNPTPLFDAPFQILLDTTNKFSPKVYKLKLDPTLGNKLLQASSTNLQDNTQFKQFFKGLRISSLHQNVILGIETISDSSRLVLHYKEQKADTTLTKTYNFFSDYTNAAKFSYFVRNNNGTQYASALDTLSIISQQYGFISSGAQNQLFFSIDLSNLNTPAINKALLEVPVDPTTFGTNYQYAPPMLLYLYTADSNYKPAALPLESQFYDYSKNMYVFDLTTEIQNIKRGTWNPYGFILTPVFPASSVNRLQILGPQNTLSNKMRLKVYSTKLD